MSVGDLSQVSVLVVDDNLQMRAVVRAILRGLSVGQVLEAETVEQAFDQVRRHNVDVIFCDWVLNPGSGIDFVLRLRRDPRSPNPYLPVIMMSAHAERSRIERARDAGVTEFLVKPITINAVLAKFVEIIERPRPFIRCNGYFGPDRRRRNDPRYAGPERRQPDGVDGAGRPSGDQSDGETVLL
ncbi:response regulator [Marinibaculum pumilum]|uniref:Response regulator n=1 Tax=Marinibaculum pumilum TaxID=1766165 RepID=A0ABV7LAZ8_9PROT